MTDRRVQDLGMILDIISSAHIFTKTMGAVIWFMRGAIDRLAIVYIGDLLIQDRGERTCHLHAEIVVILILIIQYLGYSVNSGK